MAVVLGVHGIGQQYWGAEVLRRAWWPALLDGLAAAGCRQELQESDFRMAYWGSLCRPPSGRAKGGESASDGYCASALDESSAGLLALWLADAVGTGTLENELVPKGRTPQLAQTALRRLSRTRQFVRLGEVALRGNMQQVSRYLRDPEFRQEVKSRLTSLVDRETRVIVAHSMGSVVAYECLAEHPEWSVQALVTLGSPLGTRGLIFDALLPNPINGLGLWPGSVRTWTNIADTGDAVALQKRLAPLFGSVDDVLVHNGPEAHNVVPYLTDEATGRAICSALNGRNSRVSP